jgi:hypothetical protein
MANVVEPLPDMSAASAPLARRNSWYRASTGYFSRTGASSELYSPAPMAGPWLVCSWEINCWARPGRPFKAAGNRASAW